MVNQLDFFSNVSDTSRKAYAEITADGSKVTLRQKVKEFIQHSNGITRSGIAAATGIRLSSVCGRVAELLASGEIEEAGTIEDAETGKTVYLLKARV